MQCFMQILIPKFYSSLASTVFIRTHAFRYCFNLLAPYIKNIKAMMKDYDLKAMIKDHDLSCY